MNATVAAIDQKKEIKNLHAQVVDKTALAIAFGEKYNVEPNTVRNHWFGPLTSVPKKHRENVIADLRETLANQEA